MNQMVQALSLSQYRAFGEKLLSDRGDKINPSECSYRIVSSHSSPDCDHEIFIHKSTVVESSGRCLIRILKVDQAITCVMRTQFGCSNTTSDGVGTEPSNSLSVAHGEFLTVYMDSGPIHKVSFASPLLRVWRLSLLGLTLLEMSPTSLSGQRSDASNTVTPLYSISHPLSLPVAVLPSNGDLPRNEKVVDCLVGFGRQLVVTFCEETGRHALWQASAKTDSSSLSVSLEKLWADAIGGMVPRGTQVSVSHDYMGRPVLGILGGNGVLHLLRSQVRLSPFGDPDGNANAPTFEVFAKIPGVVSAVTVAALRPSQKSGALECDKLLYEIATLSEDGRMHIWIGNHRVVEVGCDIDHTASTVEERDFPASPDEVVLLSPASHGSNSMMIDTPSPSPQKFKKTTPDVRNPSRAGSSPSPSPSIAHLKHAVADRVNIGLTDGNEFRVVFDFQCHSQLADMCLGTLERVLAYSTSSSSEFDVKTLRSSVLEASRKRVNTQLSKGGLEWENLVRILTSSSRADEGAPPSVDDSEGSWEALLKSDVHTTWMNEGHADVIHFLEVPPQPSGASLDTSRPDQSLHPSKETVTVLSRVLSTLHLLYEDMKLNTLAWRDLRPLCQLLCALAVRVNLKEYVDYYRRDFGDINAPDTDVLATAQPTNVPSPPPDIYKFLSDCLDGRASVFSVLPEEVFATTRKLVPLYCKLGAIIAEWCEHSGSLPKTLQDVGSLTQRTPFGGSPAPSGGVFSLSPAYSRTIMASPTSISGRHSNSEVAPRYRANAWTSRTVSEKLVLMMVEQQITLSDMIRLPCGVALPLREALLQCRSNPPDNWPAEAYVLIGRDDLACYAAMERSLESSEELSLSNGNLPLMKFSQASMAESEVDPPAQTAEPEDDAETDQIQDDGTQSMSSLRFSSDLRLREVGRLLRSASPALVSVQRKPETSDHEFLSQQQQQLALLCHRTLALPVGRGMYTIGTSTPLVTEALSIPTLVTSGVLPPNRASISLEKNIVPPGEEDWPSFHNGVAAGLRLAEGQTRITRTWIVYNKPEEPTNQHAGVLMALGLQGHLADLAATDVFSYLAQSHDATTIGVILGMSAAKKGSMDVSVSKMLCLHIPSLLPATFSDITISNSVQSAALLGVGLVYEKTCHRLMTEVLLNEIGRPACTERVGNREGYSWAAGIGLGMVLLGKGGTPNGLDNLHVEDKLFRFILGGKSLSKSAYSCPTIREGDRVNVDVTGHGATLALGLMYLKTNNEHVASKLAVPNSRYLLDAIRPDFVMLRVLARNIVMWDSIHPSEGWVDSQFPEFLKEKTEIDNPSVVEAIAECKAAVHTGAAFAIGLRFAGTQDGAAYRQLMKIFQAVRTEKYAKPTKTVDNLQTILTSIAFVMAGSGHLPTFKLMRSFRRVGEDTTYGNHMQLHMAIGMLFLGKGMVTLSRSDSAIACLVASFYPRWPRHEWDDRHCLQAARHLYVLSVERRCVEARDSDNGLSVHVPLSIRLKPCSSRGASTLTAFTPCLLPPYEEIASISVDSPRYWRLEIPMTEFHERSLRERQTLFVKRKVGFLSYSQDPLGFRGLLARCFPEQPQERADFVASYTADAELVAFAHKLCHLQTSKEEEMLKSWSVDPTALLTGILHECLVWEKPEIVDTMLFLYQADRNLIMRPYQHGVGLLNVRLVLQYQEGLCPDILAHNSSHVDKGSCPRPLIHPVFLNTLKRRVTKFFEGFGLDEADSPTRTFLKTYTRSGKWSGPISATSQIAVGRYLQFYNIPSTAKLEEVAKCLSDLREGPGSKDDFDADSSIPFIAMVLPDANAATASRIVQLLSG